MLDHVQIGWRVFDGSAVYTLGLEYWGVQSLRIWFHVVLSLSASHHDGRKAQSPSGPSRVVLVFFCPFKKLTWISQARYSYVFNLLVASSMYRKRSKVALNSWSFITHATFDRLGTLIQFWSSLSLGTSGYTYPSPSLPILTEKGHLFRPFRAKAGKTLPCWPKLFSSLRTFGNTMWCILFFELVAIHTYLTSTPNLSLAPPSPMFSHLRNIYHHSLRVYHL